VARQVKHRLPLLVFVLMASSAFAQDLPALTAPVNDFAHVLSPGVTAELDRRIRALQAASGDVVVVATVPSIAPFGSIDEYAVKLVEKAGIGKKNSDNGLLILLAKSERRVRIEVGYGLEQYITDGFAGETIRETMLPAFRQGSYDDGLLKGTTRVIARIAQARGVTLQDVPAPDQSAQQTRTSFPPGLLVFIALFILVMILRSRGGGPRSPGRFGGPWSGWTGGVGGFGGGFGGGLGGFGGGFGGGGGGGGFGGFGGGRSGGGGASGGW
jgi:uncharacterized protein